MATQLEAEIAARPRAGVDSDCCAVIVHYRCAQDVLACVDTLRSQEPELPVVVVENGSADPSTDRVTAGLAQAAGVTVLLQRENRGFGAGCNAGIEWCLAQWPDLRHVLLLNPDTLPQPGLVAELRATAERHPDAGVIGGRIESLDGRRVLFERGRIRPWTLGRSHAAAPAGQDEYPSEFVTGALMLVDAELLREGLRFDERYFLYVEDLDLCRQVHARGRTLWVNRRAVVRHREGGSQGSELPVLRTLRPTQLHHLARGKVLFAHKWLGPLQRTVCVAVAATIKPLVGVAIAGPRFLPQHFAGWREGRRVARAPVPPRDDPPPSDSRLCVVVLSWNGRDDTCACLRALCPELAPDDAVIVVDNGSHDGTESTVRALFPAVEVIQTGENLGFAGGNNVGLRRALRSGRGWVLLLNNDTIVQPGALRALRQHAAATRGVAALQPLLVDASHPDRVDSAGHELSRLPGARDAAVGEPVAAFATGVMPVFGACAAAAMIRADALRAHGLLDDRLFVLFEDVDLMFRLRAAGWNVELVPSAIVHHRRGVSGAGDRARRRRRELWTQRNIVALALRWWPARWLLPAAPLLAARALRALYLAGDARARCLSLWREAWSARPNCRQAMRRAGTDRWFGARPAPAVSSERAASSGSPSPAQP